MSMPKQSGRAKPRWGRVSQAIKPTELHTEILGHLTGQRATRANASTPTAGLPEPADVVMSAAVLSEPLGIDPPDALQTKTAVADERMLTLYAVRTVATDV